MRKSDRKYLRVGKAAEELGLHPITIRRWIKTGKIQAVRVAEVAVTSGDRLTRFGTEYLETLFSSFGVTFTILDPGEEKTAEQELVEDLFSIIASFAGKLYGMRSHKQKALLECAQNVLGSP